MKLLLTLFAALLLCCFSTAWASAYALRTVQSGESLGYIAGLYNLSVDVLMEFNNLSSTTLHPGDELMIPYLEATGGVAEAAPVPPPGFATYTLQNGENLSAVAELYGVDVEDIVGANPDISSLDMLPVGTELLVPPRAGLVITLAPGENLRDLIQMYGLSPLEVMDVNKFTSPADIRPGVMVFLPDVPPTRALERLAMVREAENRYIWPVHGRITSYFGRRNLGMGTSGFHRAIDVAAPYGTAVVAARSGTVTHAGWSDRGYGNLIKIRHAGGDESWYAHHSNIFVEVGEYVSQGETIGAVGSTGLSTGPHLHFELYEAGTPVDPLTHLR